MLPVIITQQSEKNNSVDSTYTTVYLLSWAPVHNTMYNEKWQDEQ